MYVHIIHTHTPNKCHIVYVHTLYVYINGADKCGLPHPHTWTRCCGTKYPRFRFTVNYYTAFRTSNQNTCENPPFPRVEDSPTPSRILAADAVKETLGLVVELLGFGLINHFSLLHLLLLHHATHVLRHTPSSGGRGRRRAALCCSRLALPDSQFLELLLQNLFVELGVGTLKVKVVLVAVGGLVLIGGATPSAPTVGASTEISPSSTTT